MEAEHDSAGIVIARNDVELQRHRPIISGEQLDIEAYAAMYTGGTKIARLTFIADKCGVPSMELDALRMAYDEIKKGENTQLFRDVAEKIDGRLGANYGLDNAWADAVDQRAELREYNLYNERLAHSKSLMVERMRMGHNDLGDFYYARGQLEKAFKNYVDTHDFVKTPKHIIDMCLNAILVSIEMGHFSRVQMFVCIAEQCQDALEPVTIAKLCCAAGLAHLEGKQYKLAAQKFLEVGPELGNNYTEVIAPQDVATYGSLCALASFDHLELKSKVIDDSNIQNFLELVPEISELITDFYTSHNASCLEYLGNLKTNLLLDIHLHHHVETLYKQIRSKFLIQYTIPYSSVNLNMIANAFNTSVIGLEKELEALITNDRVQARIDSHNEILYAQHADQRNPTFQTGNEFDRELRAMLMRANLIRHEHDLEPSIEDTVLENCRLAMLWFKEHGML